MKLRILFIFSLLMASMLSSAGVNLIQPLDSKRATDRKASAAPSNFKKVGKYIYFLASSPSLIETQEPYFKNNVIWQLDTTTNKTVAIETDLYRSPNSAGEQFSVIDNKILYLTSSGINIIDGNNKIKTRPEGTKSYFLTSNVIEFSTSKSVYFYGENPSGNDKVLWKFDLEKRKYSFLSLCISSTCYSNPIELKKVGDKLFFKASTSEGTKTLWSIDNNDNLKPFLNAPIHNSGVIPLAPYKDGVIVYSPTTPWFFNGNESDTYEIKSLKNIFIQEFTSVGSSMVALSDIIYVIENNGKGDLKRFETHPVYTRGKPTNLITYGNKAFYIQTVDTQSGIYKSFLMSFDTINKPVELFSFGESNQSSYKMLGVKGNKFLFFQNYADGPAAKIRATNLWVSDGTTIGTSKLSSNAAPIEFWSNEPYYFTDDRVYFAGFTPEHGVELWQTDGTSKGTLLAKDLGYGIEYRYVGSPVMDSKNIYYLLEHYTYNRDTGSRKTKQLWKTEKSSMQTSLVYEFVDQATTNLFATRDGVFFTDKDESENFKSHLIFYSSSTGKWKKVYTSNGMEFNNNSSSCNNFSRGDFLFFHIRIRDGVKDLCELLTSDGTVEGTIKAFTYDYFDQITSVVELNGVVYFSMSVYDSNRGLYTVKFFKVNNKERQVTSAFELPDDTRLSMFESSLHQGRNGFFILTKNTEGPASLYQWSGEKLRSIPVFNNVKHIVPFKGGVAFISDNALYHTSASHTAPVRLATLNLTSSEMNQFSLNGTPDENFLLYPEFNNSGGQNLIISDGTTVGSKIIEQFSGSAWIKMYSQIGDDLYIQISKQAPNSSDTTTILKRFSVSDGQSEEIVQEFVDTYFSKAAVLTGTEAIYFAYGGPESNYPAPFVTAPLRAGDIDADGTPNANDALPFHPDENVDTDGDFIGDNADTDDDGDFVNDTNDQFPKDALEWNDEDRDGLGDNKDVDDDNDAINDWLDPSPRVAAVVTPPPPVDPGKTDTKPTAEKSSGGVMSITISFLILLASRRRLSAKLPRF